MLEGEIEKMRRLGLTERSADGVETVRISIQCRQTAAGHTRDSWCGVLQAWEREVDRTLAPHGGRVVRDSLSVSGQTVEAVVPVAELPAVFEEMGQRDARVDLMRERRVID